MKTDQPKLELHALFIVSGVAHDMNDSSEILGAQASCLLVIESELIPKASRQDACAPSIFHRFWASLAT
jgi:hypothetical protein